LQLLRGSTMESTKENEQLNNSQLVTESANILQTNSVTLVDTG
jgi:hypothetical protein